MSSRGRRWIAYGKAIPSAIWQAYRTRANFELANHSMECIANARLASPSSYLAPWGSRVMISRGAGFRQFDAPVCIIVTYDRMLASSDDTAFAAARSLLRLSMRLGRGALAR